MGHSKLNRIQRMESEARDGIVTVLCDQSIRKFTASELYKKINGDESKRAFASGVAFLDSAVLTSVHLNESADIRQEYSRIKNYVINSSTDSEINSLSHEIDKLSHIATYIKQEQVEYKKGRASELASFYDLK